MVTRLMSRLYRCFVYVMQNCAICALPFDWDRTFLCSACDSFCCECYQALSQQLLIKRGWGLGTRLRQHRLQHGSQQQSLTTQATSSAIHNT